MRDIFVEQLTAEIDKDPSIILITADLGFGSFDNLSKNYPDNFLNVGVAEQNMIGVAAGMAIRGRKPFCYSIGNFATLRCLEQIRNDAAYHGLNITVVSNGGGFSYGGLGVTHHATEDVSVMFSIPEVEILTPSSDFEVKEAVKLCCKLESTKYLRLDKSFIQDEHEKEFQPLRNIRTGEDLKIFSYGGIIEEAFKLSKMLDHLSIGIISVPMISSINSEMVIKQLGSSKYAIVIEENASNGGLGSLLSSILMESNHRLDYFRIFSINRKFSEVVGDQEYMRKYFEIDASSIFKEVSKKI